MAFDRSDKDQDAGATAALVLADSASRLERRVAGLAAVSRMLIELDRVGVAEALVAIQPSARLAGEVRDDMARAGCRLIVRWAPRSDLPAWLAGRRGDLLILGDGALVKAAGLASLTGAGRPATLVSSDRIRAALLPVALVAGAGTAELDQIAAAAEVAAVAAEPGEVLSLTAPAAAARAVMKETGKPSDGLVSRWLNRPVSQLISSWLLHIPSIRPAQLTVLTLLMAFGMFGALVHGSPFSLALGCLLFHLTSVVDGLDGEVARATYRTSPDGARLDTAVDMATNLMFALGVTIGLTHLHGPIYAQLGAFICIGWLGGVLALSWMVKRGPGGGSFDVLKTAYHDRAGDGVVGRIVVAVRIVTSRDFFACFLAVVGLLGFSWIIPWILAAFVAVWPFILGYGAWLMLARPSRPSRAG